jgi:ATP-dependent DNA ligase
MLLNSITDPEPYLANPGWLLQRKEDGVRCIAVVPENVHAEVETFSRNDLPVAITADCARILKEIFPGSVVDLEVIGERVVVLDLLASGETDLRDYTCIDRLRAIQELFSRASRRREWPDLARGGIVSIVETACCGRDKRTLLGRLRADGSEGAVFKATGAPYKAGRQDCALKLKFKGSATLQVVAIGSKGKASVDVAASDGTVVASVSTIGRPVPAVGALIEVEYLTAHRGGKLVQPVYKTIRTDKTVADGPDSFQYTGREAR